MLRKAAGSDRRQWPNGILDDKREGELRLADFVSHEHSRMAGLEEAHVLALRVYTTAAYRSLNESLRAVDRVGQHPFPVTIFFISEGIKMLRAVAAEVDHDGAMEVSDLFRGLRNTQVTPDFLQRGGSERSIMST